MELTNDQKVLQDIVQKAWEDVTFKNNLLQNPISTIEKFLGRPINLPQGKKIAFIDQTDSSTIFINIPAKANIENMELDEEQLDIIAGGGGIDGKPPIINPSGYEGNIFG